MTARGAAALPAPPGLDDELERQWAFLAAPGSTFTGAQRLEIAAAARAARAGEPAGDGAHRRAAARIATAAHTIDAAFVGALADDGLDIHRFVETLGVVARISAIDTALRGLGRTERVLPDPEPGEPSGDIDADATIRAAFVPTVGPANPITVLNSMPQESAHQESLSNVLYLSYAEMADLDITRDLHRTQIELVAGRTSSVNECVY